MAVPYTLPTSPKALMQALILTQRRVMQCLVTLHLVDEELLKNECPVGWQKSTKYLIKLYLDYTAVPQNTGVDEDGTALWGCQKGA